MDDKLQKLFEICKEELQSVGIETGIQNIGEVSISIGKRNCKRYGCCKQEDPVKESRYVERIGRKRYVRYSRFKTHKIEISKWVMALNEDIIKNTIMHELIHCFPNCNNHGKYFKKYAKYINEKLGYDIARVGNKVEDMEKSNIQAPQQKFNYKIECMECGYIFFRQRLNCNFSRNYRCGRCGGKLQTYKGNFYKI